MMNAGQRRIQRDSRLAKTYLRGFASAITRDNFKRDDVPKFLETEIVDENRSREF